MSACAAVRFRWPRTTIFWSKRARAIKVRWNSEPQIASHSHCGFRGWENSVLCHGLVPWCLTFAATQGARDGFEDTTRLPGGGSCCLLVGPKTVSVKLHGTSPWHHCNRENAFPYVAANMTLHRTSLWYRALL